MKNGLPETIIQVLTAARHDRGWSQRELAAKVGLPQVHVSSIETGKVVPRFDTLLNFVRVLGFDLMLVPRSLVPVVQALVRDAEQVATGEPGDEERPLYGV